MTPGRKGPCMGQDVVDGSAPTGSLVVDTSSGRVRVRLLGDVDLAMVGSMRRQLHDLVVEGHTEIAVELDGVTFMDSSGLGVLVGAQRQARVFHGSLVLVAPSPPVMRLLALTSLDKVFEVRPGADDA